MKMSVCTNMLLEIESKFAVLFQSEMNIHISGRIVNLKCFAVKLQLTCINYQCMLYNLNFEV